jgi:hypothetical protein
VRQCEYCCCVQRAPVRVLLLRAAGARCGVPVTLTLWGNGAAQSRQVSMAVENLPAPGVRSTVTDP